MGMRTSLGNDLPAQLAERPDEFAAGRAVGQVARADSSE
jgi:hypothetical protein